MRSPCYVRPSSSKPLVDGLKNRRWRAGVKKTPTPKGTTGFSLFFLLPIGFLGTQNFWPKVPVFFCWGPKERHLQLISSAKLNLQPSSISNCFLNLLQLSRHLLPLKRKPFSAIAQSYDVCRSLMAFCWGSDTGKPYCNQQPMSSFFIFRKTKLPILCQRASAYWPAFFSASFSGTKVERWKSLKTKLGSGVSVCRLFVMPHFLLWIRGFL